MTGLRTRARRLLGKHVGPTAVVLIYHRVAELDHDPQLLAVSREEFDAQMRLIASEYSPVSLNELAESLAHRSLPDQAVAITFDDGYADNLHAAEPILSRHGVPATVFVSSGYVEAGQEFWWDELERVFLEPGELPSRIEIATAGVVFTADLGDSAEYSAADAARHRDWNVLERPRNERQAAYVSLAQELRPLSAAHRSEVLAELRRLAAAAPDARQTHRPLDADEVRALDESPLAEVGGHTVSHQLLSRRTLEEQREEIVSDMEAIEGLCGRRPTSFSYPYGGLDDYTDDTVTLVKGAGYRLACSNHPGTVKPWTDPFRIPRHIVRNWPAEELSRRLEAWFDGGP